MKEYQDRFRGSLIRHYDNKIRKAKRELGSERKRKGSTALWYYDKSLALFHTELSVFLQEAVELAVKASQLYLEAEPPEGSEHQSFWGMEATTFFHTGNCFFEAGDKAAAAHWYRAAIDRQTKALELSDDPKDSRYLKIYEPEYNSVKNLTGYTPVDRQTTLKKAPVTKKPSQQAPAPKQVKPQKLKSVQNADGTQTVTYQDGSRYIGQWKDGQREGFGEIVFSSGASYRGEWKADKMCGHGVRMDI